MNCLINKAIEKYSRQGRRADVIHRYIRMKYRISIDQESIKARLRGLSMNYELT
ncbi:hypothetical protein AB9P05_07770 [Roseivirga sp. BDSF3-8]|uniref:hypothetical protein n=1 Tax=Roseivirga sp. BDSF3-8 TaxID=3241598 RepID=UPI00353206A6